MASDEKSANTGPAASGHNYSLQKNVLTNPDPALDRANEHVHGHLHHNEFSERGREGSQPVYTVGTTYEPPTIPNASPLHRKSHGSIKYDTKAPDPGGLISASLAADAEKGKDYSFNESNSVENGSGNEGGWSFKGLYRKYRVFVHLFIFCLFTGWWIASLILHRDDKNWIIPFLLWLCISLRLLTLHVPVTYVTKPVYWTWNNSCGRVAEMIPEKMRIPAGALLVIAVILVGAFASEETEDNSRENRAVSLFGLLVFVLGFWATSRDRTRIQWQTVLVGMLTQFIIALFVLRTGAGYNIFNFVASLAQDLLGYAKDGVEFLTDSTVIGYPWFLTNVLPAIIFFVAFVSILYYWGALQWLVVKCATFFFWSMKVSGAEAVVAAASPFIGQGESAMLIKPFVAHLTDAELHQIMCSGFATISGSVLIGYISIGVSGEVLISSCVMSIPASLAISKLRWPETEETLTAGRVVVPDDDEHRASNVLHAFANGAWLGLKIAGMIGATLLCIIALVGLINGLLGWWGRYINIDSPPLSLELILGYICYPIAFLLGVPRGGNQLRLVGQLIGVKVIENEYVAYSNLQTLPQYAALSPRSRLIATYALCGFGNIGSLGTQIGVLSQIAPGRSGDVARVALSALISGVFATLSSATIAGMVITDQRQFSQTSASAISRLLGF